MTLHERVLHTAQAQPSQPALVHAPTGEAVTYGALAERVCAVAAGLQRRGFGRGDVLSLWAPNMPPWAGVALGAMASGGAVSPIGPAATPHEVASAVRSSGARLLVTLPSLAAGAREAVDVEVVPIGDELLGGGRPAPAADRSAVAMLPFSSGTTGTPKAIPLTHGNVVSAVDQLQLRVRFTADDVVLAVAPFAHVMGSVVTLAAPLCAGATVITLPRFDLEGFLGAIERQRVTFVAVPPPVMRVFARHPLVDRFDLSSVEVIACGGAALAPALQREVAARLPGVCIGQAYGMTETSVLITAPDRAEGTTPGCVGRPSADTEVRIVDGELHVRGPHVIGDGWLATGDLAEIADNGELRIVGRAKELIKVNGYQVAPAELEALMLEFPGVEDAAVAGVPDEERGEAVIAFVVGEADLGALRDWLGERVAPYKRPREYRSVETLPRTPAGKLLRRELAPVAV